MKNLFYILVLMLAISSCQDDVINTTTNTPIVNPPTTETDGSLGGKVVNADGDGIAQVQISLYGNTTQTDANGDFSFTDVSLFEDGTYVQASKEGYFDGSRKFYATEDVSYVQIQLIDKQLTQTVSASSGGMVSFETATVDLPSGDYIDKDGQPYTGSVNVYATWLDPTMDATFEQMPGDLTGVNEEGDLQGLISFGMIGVELEDTDGNAVQLPEGETAQISMTVPDALLATAPASIPLWHFDEENGTWVEEGEAQLVNGIYEGSVKHFSFWNCDAPFDLITITGTINVSGISADNRLIRITNLASGMSATGYTNNRGLFTGKVPKDEPLTIEVFDDCGGVIQSFPQSALSVDTNIGTLDVMGSFNSFSITGTVSTCSATPPSSYEVYLVTAIGNHVTDTDASGNFSFSLAGCSGASIDYYARDRENDLVSERFSITTTGSQDVGNIETCIDYLEPGIFLEYDGQTIGMPGDSSLVSTYSTDLFDLGNGLFKNVVTVTILDWFSAEVTEGTFTYTDGDTEAEYEMAIPQGFNDRQISHKKTQRE